MAAQNQDWISREEMNRNFSDSASKAGDAKIELIRRHDPNSGMYYSELGEIFAHEAEERIDALRRAAISKQEKTDIAEKLAGRAEEIYLMTIESYGVRPETYRTFVTRMQEKIKVMTLQVHSWEDPLEKPKRQLKTIEEKKAARFKLLEAAYNASGGDISHIFNIYLLGDEFALSQEDTRIEATHLSDQGFLAKLNVRVGICNITNLGVTAYEGMIQNPEKGTEHFPPISVVNNFFHGPVGMVQTGDGTISIQGSVIQNVQSLKGTGAEDIANAFSEIIEGIANSDYIHENLKEEALQIIDTLIDEAKKPKAKWKKGVVVALIPGLAGILSKAADLTTLWQKWGPIIQKFFE